LYVLVSDEEFTAERVLADLPEPDALMDVGVFIVDGTRIMHPAHHTAETGCVWPALALEKIKQYDKALLWATKAIDVDQTQGGTPVSWQITLAL
jgi:hypothetical protein